MINIKSLKFDADEKLLDFTEKKVGKVEKFFDNLGDIDVTLSLLPDAENKCVKLQTHMPGEEIGKCLHPYTKALVASVFDIKMDFSKKIEQIKGEVPSPLDAPKGCPFCDRCDCSSDICFKEKPKLVEISEGHEVACHRFKEGAGAPEGAASNPKAEN